MAIIEFRTTFIRITPTPFLYLLTLVIVAMLHRPAAANNESTDVSIFQAEDAVFSPRFEIKTNNPGFTGSGYVEALGEGSIEWSMDTSVIAGGTPPTSDHTLDFRYFRSTLKPQTQPLEIYVNDELVESEMLFSESGAENQWLNHTLEVQLQDGPNTIRLQTTGLRGAISTMPSIDYLSVNNAQNGTINKGDNSNYRYLKASGSIIPRPDQHHPELNDPDYSESYYGCVDPSGKRSTLSDWKNINGFDGQLNTVSADYINAFELGFGRQMNCLENSENTACYVENFSDPKGESRFFATVVMERIDSSETCSDANIIAFFAYDPQGNRVNQATLDSEGPKSIPESCYTCHGGKNINGIPLGEAHFIPWNTKLLEDWNDHEILAPQADAFRRLNLMVWEDANKFNRGRLKSLIESWYGGIPYSGMVFNEEEPFHEIEDQKKVPKDKSKNDWFSDPKGHLATDNLDILNHYKREKSLYTNIYAPYCQTCHVLQKTDWSNAVDFNNAAFKLICEKQKPMPQAELTNHRFKTDTLKVEHSETITTPFQELCSQAPLPQAVPTTESDGTSPLPSADDPAKDNSEDGSLPPSPNLSDTD